MHDGFVQVARMKTKPKLRVDYNLQASTLLAVMYISRPTLVVKLY